MTTTKLTPLIQMFLTEQKNVKNFETFKTGHRTIIYTKKESDALKDFLDFIGADYRTDPEPNGVSHEKLVFFNLKFEE